MLKHHLASLSSFQVLVKSSFAVWDSIWCIWYLINFESRPQASGHSFTNQLSSVQFNLQHCILYFSDLCQSAAAGSIQLLPAFFVNLPAAPLQISSLFFLQTPDTASRGRNTRVLRGAPLTSVSHIQESWIRMCLFLRFLSTDKWMLPRCP